MARTLVGLTLAFLLLAPIGGALSVDAPTPFPLMFRYASEPLLEVDAPVLQQHAPTPATAIGIGPGSHLLMSIPGEGTFGCTANFVWQDGAKLYLGAAGHCFLPPSKSATHGPAADYDASGVVVRVCVATCNFGGQLGFFSPGVLRTLGPVVYARQDQGGVAVGNDFGLVEIPASLHHEVRSTMPVWRGPTTATPALASGPVCLYGNGLVVGETFPTMARTGVGAANSVAAGSWQAIIPSNSGDSGAALITCGPDATGVHGAQPVGILTHGVGVVVAIPGLALGTSVVKAQQMATQAGLTISLVPGQF